MPQRNTGFFVHGHTEPGISFWKEVRTFSHGCIRFGGAIDLVKTLLAGSATAEEVDDILAS